MGNNLIHRETNIRHKLNGFYNLSLMETHLSKFSLIVSMSICFHFIPSIVDRKTSWTNVETIEFINEWNKQIYSKWNSIRPATFKESEISISFQCDTYSDRTKISDWNIAVQKLRSRALTAQSLVWRNNIPINGYGRLDALFDSNDDLKKMDIGDKKQTSIMHEFGHMIGLDDEYYSTADENSIMSKGSELRERHYAHLLAWAIKKLQSEDSTS